MRWIWVLSSLALLSGCNREESFSRHDARGTEAKLRAAAEEILPWIQDQSPFLLSPDGGQLLVKREIGGGDTELYVTALETGKLIGRRPGGTPLLISWRPGGALLSFVQDDHGDRNYRLMFWTPEDGEIITPNAPVMHSAHRLMRWSPDGRRLAFCAAERAMQSGPLLLLEADSPEKASSVVLQRTDIQDYAWSPNSQKLAVAASDSRKVAILDMGEKRRGAIQVNTDCAVMYLALTHDSSGLVVAGAESDKGWFVLRKVDLATGASRIIFRHEGRIRDITPLEDGSVVFRAVSEGTGKLMVAAPDGNCEPLPFGEGTTSLLAANEAKRALYAAHTGIVTPLGLYEMNVDRRTSRLVFQPSPLQGVRGTAPATAYVSIPNGPTLPVRVWRSKTRPPRGAIIVFPNGRGDEKGSPVYSGSIQYFVQKGYDYIAFDFQPNGEEALNEMDIRYSLAVIDYARNQLGASPEKTVLYGGSLATNYVVETARHLRETAGGLVLRGITRSASDGESGFDHGFRVAAFQGENDPVSPATARAYLECVFGPRALSGANGFFYILQNEGHTPRLLSSRALVYAGIVELLER